jgi:hypothetical protein
MGINVKTGAWGCWRRKAHRGRTPLRIVQALKGCTWREAEIIVGVADEQASPESLESLRAHRLFAGTPVQERQAVEWPMETRLIGPGLATRRHWEYLVGRGFPEEHVEALVRRYGLRASLSAVWSRRVLFPFKTEAGLIGWTGRALGKSEVRYKNFPPGGGNKDFVFNQARAGRGGRVLAVVEGPVDAVKLDFYGAAHGVCAVAVLGVGVTRAQLAVISRLAHRFDAVSLVLDDDAQAVALTMAGELACLRPRLAYLPAGRHDPGELTPCEADGLARGMVAGLV